MSSSVGNGQNIGLVSLFKALRSLRKRYSLLPLFSYRAAWNADAV